VFVNGARQGGFHSPDSALTAGQGGMFPVISAFTGGREYVSCNVRPAPFWGPRALILWTGPCLIPPIFNRDVSEVWVAWGLSGDRGRELRKRHPTPYN